MPAIANNEAWHIFFDIYRGLPELWDMRSDGYKSKTKKKTAFAKLLDIYKMIDASANADSLRRRLHNIKSCYWREAKKVQASHNSGDIEKYVPSLWYFNLLGFLRDSEVLLTGSEQEVGEDGTAKTQAVTSEHPPARPTYEESRKRLRSYLDQMSERNSRMMENANKKFKSSRSLQTSQPHTIFKKILPKGDQPGPAITDQEQPGKDDASTYADSWATSFRKLPPKLRILDSSQAITDQEQPGRDDASTYADSWATSFRKLSPTQKIYAKKAIEDILVLGQLDCLTLNTVDIISASANAPYS